MIDAARLRITLQYIEPAPWREIEVPLTMSLKNLHDAIQAAFLWFDSHLWAFDIDGKRYGVPFDEPDFGGPKTLKAANAKLAMLRDKDIRKLVYTYDFGDDWRHRIEVQEFFEAESGARLPRFTGGEYRAPPEDVGGPPGFEYFLDVLGDPSHEEHADLLDWHGGPFDGADIERDQIRILMGRLAKRRPRKA